jgi:hypothetical protein
MMEPEERNRRRIRTEIFDFEEVEEQEWLVPLNAQFLVELERMRRFDKDLSLDGPYRLNSGPFFFKLVRRHAATNSSGMPLGLGDPNAYIAIPVAPKILFVAAHNQALIDALRAENPTTLVREMNTRLIQQARKYVWGTTDSQLTHIQRNIGKLPDRVILTDEQKQAAINAIPQGEAALDLLLYAARPASG